jgi:hypothetical protein
MNERSPLVTPFVMKPNGNATCPTATGSPFATTATAAESMVLGDGYAHTSLIRASSGIAKNMK